MSRAIVLTDWIPDSYCEYIGCLDHHSRKNCKRGEECPKADKDALLVHLLRTQMEFEKADLYRRLE